MSGFGRSFLLSLFNVNECNFRQNHTMVSSWKLVKRMNFLENTHKLVEILDFFKGGGKIEHKLLALMLKKN